MGIINVLLGGSTKNTQDFLKRMEQNTLFDALDRVGQDGVAALELATPRDSGIAAGSWYYTITKAAGYATVSWKNYDRTPGGTPIVILLQYGHRTGTGGYVEGKDIINPALTRVFKEAIDSVWKAVQS